MSHETPEDAIALLESHSEAALATVEDGRPYASAAGYLYERAREGQAYGTLFVLLSDLARHTRNLHKNPALSLLVAENADLPIHEKKRASIQGAVERVDSKEKHEQLKAEYLKRFPRSEIFFTLPDFRFYAVKISQIHWIGGFGKAATFK